MKFLFYRRSFMLRMCAVCCVAAIATSLYAQSQHPRAILELKACGDLQVFEDGTVLESRGGKKTERRLSESRMLRLRQVIAGAPWAREWKQAPAVLPDLNKLRVTVRTNVHDDDCNLMWLSYGAGLVEVQVTLHYPERQTEVFPVYIVCERAKKIDKDQAKRYHQRSLKRNWQRFLKDVVSAADSKSILKNCKCW